MRQCLINTKINLDAEQVSAMCLASYHAALASRKNVAVG